MKVLFLTEAGKTRGWGHLVRCSALSEEFIRRGVETGFVVNADREEICSGKNLPGGKMEFYDWTVDFDRLSFDIKGADIAVVDSYLADQTVYGNIARGVESTVFLDDCHRLPYPFGIVVNGAVSAQSIVYPADKNIRYLIGPEYTILRKEFRQVVPKTIRPEIRHILVVFGGTDAANHGKKTIDALIRLLPEARIYWVNGIPQKENERLHIISDASAAEMKCLMDRVDIAVTAAGQTLNELAFCGTPAIAFPIAENQSINIEGWSQNGFISGAADWTNFPDEIDRLKSPEERQRRSRTGQSVIDGRGAERIVREALKRFYQSRLTVRKAEGKDVEPLFYLANDPEVRRNSFSTDPIARESHRRWFDRIMDDDSVFLFIFEINGVFAGQVRLDNGASETVVSIGIVEDFRGLSLGKKMIESVVNMYAPTGRTFAAYIKPDNKASRRMFEKAGFHPAGTGKWVLEK